MYVANTITGVWNLHDSREQPNGRAIRWAHSLTMLASEGGLVASSVMGLQHRTHRNVAVASMSVGAVSAAAMYVYNRR